MRMTLAYQLITFDVSMPKVEETYNDTVQIELAAS
jgi:hypothetical protein